MLHNMCSILVDSC